MSRRVPLVLTAFAAAALLTGATALASSKRAADSPTLDVTFNANNTVTVALPNGTPVGASSGTPTTIPPGTYNISISDPTFVSDILWDLSGPGVKLVSSCSYGEEPAESWVETFAPNSTYTWQDDNRSPPVFTFVTSSTAASTGGAPQAPLTSTNPIASSSNGKASSSDVVGSQTGTAATLQGTIAATVSAAGAISFKFKGKAVTTLKSGKYTFKVTDDSTKAGFNVQQTGNTAHTITTGPFHGTKSQTITLGKGQWFVYGTFVGKKTYFLVTA
jgi:hypothetical protein